MGEQQARLVAALLAPEVFHLAVSSDLRRALATGEAIVAANASLQSIEQWEVARERCFGEFEGKPAENLINAVKSKSREQLLGWGPVGGETGMEFRGRVGRFLEQLGVKVEVMEQQEPVVLLTTHGGFIKELNHVLAEGGCAMPGKPGEHGRICPNTGVSRYRLELGQAGSLVSAQCSQLHHQDHLLGEERPEPVNYGL